MKIRYVLLASIGACIINGTTYAAINCAKAPTCAELGYNKSAADCEGKKAVLCPFDHAKMFCFSSNSSSGDTSNNSSETPTDCRIGSILYDDKKCYTSTPKNRTPIAIVFDSNKRLALGVKTKSGSWGRPDNDITTLPNGFFDTDGQLNTNNIVSEVGIDFYYAAVRCLNDGPEWFLPSVDNLEIFATPANRGLVSTAFSNFFESTTHDTLGPIWTSNEVDAANAYVVRLDYGITEFVSPSIFDITESRSKNAANINIRCAIAY